MHRFAILIFGISAGLFTEGIMMNRANAADHKHIVFVGASVGHGWNIEGLPQRIGTGEFSFEFIGEYQFDKSPAIKQVLGMQHKPDAVILKECAAYFPGDFEGQKRQVEGWIDELQRNGIVVIPATIVPVTSPRLFTMAYLKNLVKRVLPLGKIPVEDKQKYIAEYNDWIRQYAQEKGLTVLDLEAGVRRTDADRRLRDDLTSGDGLHLNWDAYALLDKIVVPTLQEVRWNE